MNGLSAGDRRKVEDVMDPPLPTVQVSDAISVPGAVFREGAVVVVQDGSIIGLLTTTDVINYLGKR